jgi:two-component system sensor kinase FixL
VAARSKHRIEEAPPSTLLLVEALANSLECGLVFIDEAERVAFASEAFAMMIGRHPREVQEMSPGELVEFVASLVDDPPERLRLRRVLADERSTVVCEEFSFTRPGETVVRWVARRLGGPLRGQVIICTDITAEQKLADSLERLHRTQHELMEVSRRAGMADVATTVLHNVGNVLNSVNVSVGLTSDRLRNSRAGGVRKAAGALTEVLGAAPPGGERTSKLINYLSLLGEKLEEDEQRSITELEGVAKGLEHIKVIVSMQQSHARNNVGVHEKVAVSAVLEEAVKAVDLSGPGRAVELARDYGGSLRVEVDRHKLLQILVNLITNAVDALAAAEHKRILLRARPGEEGRFAIEVEDTGCGIALERLNTIFQFGFTTKPDGHGFGLHGSANMAREMGGTLVAFSDGVDRGARFVLDLPVAARR